VYYDGNTSDDISAGNLVVEAFSSVIPDAFLIGTGIIVIVTVQWVTIPVT